MLNLVACASKEFNPSAKRRSIHLPSSTLDTNGRSHSVGTAMKPNIERSTNVQQAEPGPAFCGPERSSLSCGGVARRDRRAMKRRRGGTFLACAWRRRPWRAHALRARRKRLCLSRVASTSGEPPCEIVRKGRPLSPKMVYSILKKVARESKCCEHSPSWSLPRRTSRAHPPTKRVSDLAYTFRTQVQQSNRHKCCPASLL